MLLVGASGTMEVNSMLSTPNNLQYTSIRCATSGTLSRTRLSKTTTITTRRGYISSPCLLTRTGPRPHHLTPLLPALLEQSHNRSLTLFAVFRGAEGAGLPVALDAGPLARTGPRHLLPLLPVQVSPSGTST